MSEPTTTWRCPCGKALEEPLERIGRHRAMCSCGSLVLLTPAAQAAYAQEAPGTASPVEPPPAGAPEPTGPERAPAPAGDDGHNVAGPAGATGWSEAEISAPAQLPAAADEPDPEPEPAPPPPPPRRADLGDWLAGA